MEVMGLDMLERWRTRVALITGTREPVPEAEAHLIRAAVEWADIVIVGDCPTGVDAFARDLCEGVTAISVHKADWTGLGKAAGPQRNAAMVREAQAHARGRATVRCFAFPSKGSRGTWDCLRQAADAGIRGRVEPL